MYYRNENDNSTSNLNNDGFYPMTQQPIMHCCPMMQYRGQDEDLELNRQYGHYYPYYYHHYYHPYYPYYSYYPSYSYYPYYPYYTFYPPYPTLY